MSRLESHIRQKIAQRDSIDLAARWLAGEDGLIVEFGLGGGRSYSHLRERFPGREIFCFDRRVFAPPDSRPPDSHLYVGDLSLLLADPALHARFAGRAMLIHSDIGIGSPEDSVSSHALVDRVHGWLRPRGLLLCDQELSLEPVWGLEPVDVQGHVEHAHRFHVYRRAL